MQENWAQQGKSDLVVNITNVLLQEEVSAESKRVWRFIIEREIEAPDRFQAIQSYR